MANSIEDRIKKVLRALNEASEKITSAGTAASSADQGILSSTSEIEQAKRLLSHAVTEIQNAEIRLEQLTRREGERTHELKELKEALSESRNKAGQLQDVLQVKEDNISQLNRQVKSLNERLNIQVEQLTKREAEHEQEEEKLQKALSESKNKAGQLQDELQVKEDNISQLNRQVKSLNEKLVSQEQDIEETLEWENSRNKKAQKEIDRLRIIISGLEKEVAEIRAKTEPNIFIRWLISPIVNIYRYVRNSVSVGSISAVRISPGAGLATLIMSIVAALPLGISLNTFGANSGGNDSIPPFSIRITDTTRSLPVDTTARFRSNQAIQELIAPATLAFIYGGPNQSGQNMALLQYYSKLYSKHAWLLNYNLANPVFCNDSLLQAEKKALDNLAIGTYSIRAQNTTRNLMRNKIENASSCAELIDINFQIAIDALKQIKKVKKPAHSSPGGAQYTSGSSASNRSRNDKPVAHNHQFSNNMDHCEALVRQLYANSKNDTLFRNNLDRALRPFIDSLPASVENFIHRDNCWCKECQERMNAEKRTADTPDANGSSNNSSESSSSTSGSSSSSSDKETDCLGC